MDNVADLSGHLQQAIPRGESHAALAIKVQNIRAELQRTLQNKEAERG